MSDRYGELVQSGLGRTVAKNLGLPTPIKLDRYEDRQPVLRGEVALYADADTDVGHAVLDTLNQLDAKITFHHQLPQKLSDEHARFKVVIFDATALKNTQDLKKAYDFFHVLAKRIKSSGRVIVIARPACCVGQDIDFALAQRAMLGFVKSIGKEFKKGITANILYTKIGAEPQLDHALRFFMSAKSAYVSGQALTIGGAELVDADEQKPLLGKKILVTGASRGIGEAIAKVLARDGTKVYCLDVHQSLPDLQKVAGQIGGHALPLDITNPNAPQEILKACGKLDAIVHNAGITRDKTLAKMSEDQWTSVLDVNLNAISFINQYLLGHDGLADDGRIVCVSSISGIAGNLGQTNYAMSKAGVIGLVEMTAQIFKESKRTINAVAPGFIETKMTGAIPFAIREAGRRMNSMSQGGEPVDVAETISWLLSPQAGGINGQVVRVCGQSLLGA